MSDMPSFGAWLRQQRRSRDLTQVEFAELVGCALGTLRNIETGTARPSKQLAARFARVLGVAENDINALVAFARDVGKNEAQFPSSLTSSTAPTNSQRTNLPAQLTGLVGRTDVMAAVRALLLRPDVRLVTLTGPGGTGKTRVAMQVASTLFDTFTDGVYFVDLATITHPDVMLATVAQTLGITEGGQPFPSVLATALREHTALLLLDNFETVLEGAPAIADLLAACPKVKALVTSRIALGVAGEYVWPVPPLALPDRANVPPIRELEAYEAVRLFSERACAANPQFAITERNAPAVVEICHQLDGLPLAIELAAAWIKLFPPHVLLTRLNNQLRFPSGGRDRPSRQQTMSATIAWSYALLSPAEQQLFQRLSVFAGGATLATIEAVCGETDEDVVQHVSALVNHSLLRTLPDQPQDVQKEPRVGMLDTIREYAFEQLANSSEVEAIQQRHANYFLELAEQAATQWNTPKLHEWIETLNREYDNMRAALQWARNTGDSVIGLRIAGALWKFWQGYGYTSEGRAWLDQMLTLDVPHPDATTMVARLGGLQAAAWLASGQNDDVQAAAMFEQSMLLRRALRETNVASNLLVNAARQARTEGDYQRATTVLEEALARHHGLREQIRHGSADLGLSLYDLAVVLRILGLVRREQGQFAVANALFEECVAMHRKFGDREGVAFSLIGLADVARDQGDAANVYGYASESLAILRDLNVGWMTGFVLNTLAQGAYFKGDLIGANTLIAESVTLFRDLNAYSSLAEVLITQGYILRARGETSAALDAMHESLRLAWAVGPRIFLAAALEGIAVVETARGHADQIVPLLVAAATLRAQMNTPMRPVDQTEVDHARITAQTALGTGFTVAWTMAQALPIERVVGGVPGGDTPFPTTQS